jgi:hypothetical protein
MLPGMPSAASVTRGACHNEWISFIIMFTSGVLRAGGLYGLLRGCLASRTKISLDIGSRSLNLGTAYTEVQAALSLSHFLTHRYSPLSISILIFRSGPAAVHYPVVAGRQNCTFNMHSILEGSSLY